MKIDIDVPVAVNIQKVVRALEKDVDDMTVVVLDRPRYEELVQQISATGTLRRIRDGEVAASVTMAVAQDPSIC